LATICLSLSFMFNIVEPNFVVHVILESNPWLV
jgi:hypothetical protein